MPTELLLDRPSGLRDLRARVRVGALPTALTLLLVAWLLTFIAIPVVVVLARSVAAKDGGITLAHFATFFRKAYFLRSLINTLILGASVTALVMGLGFALAHLVTRGPRALRWPLRALTLAPLVAPPYLFGLALIIIGGRRGFIAQKYAPLIDALYSDSDHVKVEAQVTYEDGRVGTIRADVKIRDADVFAGVTAAAVDDWREFVEVLPI